MLLLSFYFCEGVHDGGNTNNISQIYHSSRCRVVPLHGLLVPPGLHPGALGVNVVIIVICKGGCRIERIRDCRHLFSGGSKEAISIRVRKYG